ncbi:MAG: alanyl-tRNA editing protein [Acidimicrobiales bacterium]
MTVGSAAADLVVPTELLYQRDSYLATFDAAVVAVDGAAVALDRTAFYPTGGGQPHDTGWLEVTGAEPTPGASGAGRHRVIAVRHGPVAGGPVPAGPAAGGSSGGSSHEVVWHELGPGAPEAGGDAGDHTGDNVGDNAAGRMPAVGDRVVGRLDWERRYRLMRAHTALHILCGVIWHRYGKAVTGGSMAPAGTPAGAAPVAVATARMDFEFDPLPPGFGALVETLVNTEIAADRPIAVTFLDRRDALYDEDLVRTKTNLVPRHVGTVRVVDILGLDKQADGGTHVASTGEVGVVVVTKTESKGKGNKRIRIEIRERHGDGAPKSGTRGRDEWDG